MKIAKPSDLINSLAGALDSAKGKELGGKFNTSFSFDISGTNGGKWTLVLDGNDPHVEEGLDPKAGCTIACSDEHFVALINGTKSAAGLFLTGKLKVSNKSLATRLGELAALAG